MSSALQSSIQTWVTLVGGAVSMAYIVHASGALTERLSEHDRAIVDLRQMDRESSADRRALAVIMERCLTTMERIEKGWKP